MNKLLIAVFILLTNVSVTSAQECIATWDDPTQIYAGWEKATTNTFLEYHETEGNPAGYIVSYGNLYTGIKNRQPDFTGNFVEKKYNRISIDIKPIMVQLSAYKPSILLRYSSSFASWKYELSNFTNIAGAWQHFEVNFSPAWTDEQAMANGWSLDEGPVKTFRETLEHVNSVVIKIAYVPNSSAFLGYDNFSLKYVPAQSSSTSGTRRDKMLPNKLLGTKGTTTKDK